MRWSFFLLLLGGFFLLKAPAQALERVPQSLTLSGQGVQLRELLRLGPQDFPSIVLAFPALLQEEDLQVVRQSKDCRIVFQPLGEGPPEGPVAKRLAALQAKKEKVQEGLAALSLEEKHLKELKRLPGESAQDFLTALSSRYRQILEKKRALQKELAQLHRREEALRQALSLKKFTYFRLQALCTPPRTLELVVEYPVEGVSFRREREVQVLPGRGQLIIRDFLRLKESLGKPFSKIEILWETSPPGPEILKPPPFHPWWVGEPPIRPMLKIQAGARLKAPGPPPKPTLYGKLYRLRHISLRPGISQLLPLETRKLPADFRVEIPAYFRPRAYLAVSFRPGTYLPQARTRFFLGKVLLSQRRLSDLRPGQKYTFYLGSDPWVEVEKEILKDYQETVGVVRKMKRWTRIWKIKVRYHHPQSLPVVLYERLPVSRRKEVKVKVKANPPWDDLSPEGRALWRFNLREGQNLIIRLEAVVEFPVS
ncbi:MAG: hypothetical protein DSZ24_00590 [Thermodesulfatator sp.]|nr:MAG: hypothetical protein DSZ24_00590 [Thermodesulfatator sp.]